MSTDAEFLDEWREPTEAEKKENAIRRARNDKITQRIGYYLLRGHRMLNTYCDNCATVLMKNPETQVDICVACEEVDKTAQPAQAVPTNKAAVEEKPAVKVHEAPVAASAPPSQGAPTHVIHTPLQSHAPAAPTRPLSFHPLQPLVVHGNDAHANAHAHAHVHCSSAAVADVNAAADALSEKLRAASELLRTTSNVSDASALCRLIKDCAEALVVVRSLQHQQYSSDTVSQ